MNLWSHKWLHKHVDWNQDKRSKIKFSNGKEGIFSNNAILKINSNILTSKIDDTQENIN